MLFIKSFLGFVLALLAATAFAAVDVNQASQPELESIKGIGPSMSGRILDARKSGAFTDWGDLLTRVKGVGDGNATKFSAEGLTVNGKAYAAVPVAAKAAPKAAKADAGPAPAKALKTMPAAEPAKK